MKVEEITIFFPDGNKTYFKVEEYLITTKEDKKEKTDIKIEKIEIGEKVCKIILSNKKTFHYKDMPFSFTSI